MVKIIAKARILAEMEEKPVLKFAPDFDLKKVTTEPSKPGAIAEFVGTGDFAQAWSERQRYEVAAGREMEPLLYESIYSIINDSTLPRIMPIHRMGPAQVVFNEIVEGGEVKFMTVTASDVTLRIKHHGVGLEYSKDLRIFNELWSLAPIERQTGVAHNALLNHIHLYPIISYTYAAANKTNGTTLTSFLATEKLPYKYLRTIEAAIVHAKKDTTNPRRGPYDLLVAGDDVFTVERALNRVNQQGFDEQSSALGMIRNVIAYDGWTGTRGKKADTYTGVTAGKAYLVHTGNKDEDFVSAVKQGLEQTMGNPDVSRFIEEQTVWDTYFGSLATPAAAVEEITWPGATDGAS